MKDSESLNNFIKQPYHDNLEYLEYLEECRSICNSIFIHRNITLNESKLIEQLRRIDGLQNHECFRDEE